MAVTKMNYDKQFRWPRYELWITHNNGKEKTKAPLLPETVRVSYSDNVQSVKTVDLGEVLVKSQNTTREISLDLTFPAAMFPGAHVKTIQRPERLKNRLVRYQRSTKPIRLIITETGINLRCMITKLSYNEQGGDKGTLYVSLTLKEYRQAKVRRVRVNANNTATLEADPSKTFRPDDRETPTTYMVKKGDSLKMISKQFLGDAELYGEIVKLNPQIVHPSLLSAGTLLKLPA